MESGWIVALLGGAGLAAAASMHCLAMCGPLAAATQSRGGGRASARYLGGRLIGYSTLGALAGGLGQGLLATRWARWVEAILAWALTVMLLHAAWSLLGFARGPRLLRLGLRPRVSFSGRLLARAAHDPLLLGAATALLPCGALFSALLASAALGRAGLGALAMLSFALLTSPALLGAAQLSRLSQLGPRGKRALGLMLIAGALVTAARPVASLRAEGAPSCHAHGTHAHGVR